MDKRTLHQLERELERKMAASMDRETFNMELGAQEQSFFNAGYTEGLRQALKLVQATRVKGYDDGACEYSGCTAVARVTLQDGHRYCMKHCNRCTRCGHPVTECRTEWACDALSQTESGYPK